MLTRDGHLEAEHHISLPGGKQFAVQIQTDLVLVGVGLDLGDLLSAVHIPAAAEVDKRLGVVPGRFVQIKSILLELAVEGDKPFLVFAVLAALVPAVRAEIEQVPHMGGPQPGPRFDHAQHMLVVDALVALGVVALLRRRALIRRVGIGAILRKADAAVGEFGVVFVKEVIVLFQLTQIPAEVEVVAVDVGNFEDRAVGVQHKDIGHRGGAGGVECMAQFVEGAVVFQQLFVDGGGSRDLVGQAPDRDAGVVVILHDQFGHLGEGVFPPAVHMHRDIGDLGPNDKTVFIAEVVEKLGVLVVGQTQRVGPQFLDDGHILLHHGGGQRGAGALAVLMAGDPAQRIAAAVEQEALLRVDLKFPAAEPGADRVPAGQTGGSRVEVRVVQAVPEVHILDRKVGAGAAVRHRHGPGLAGQGKCDLGIIGRAFYPRLGHDGGGAFFQIDHRCDLQPRSAVIAQRKMGLGHQNQADIPVQPAVKGEIRLLRVDSLAAGVADRDSQLVVVLQVIGQIHPEGRIPAGVLGQLFAVQIDFGRHGRALKFQPDPAVFRRFRPVQVAEIPAFAPVVVVAAVLAVLGVPGVGQRYRDARNIGGVFGLDEGPILIQRMNGTHRCFPFLEDKSQRKI